MPNRRTPRRPRRRVPTTTGTSRNANSGVLTQEVIEQASQAALERGGSVSDVPTISYVDTQIRLHSQLADLTRALEAGTYNVAPGNLQQGAVLQVEDLGPTFYGISSQVQPINVLGRLEPMEVTFEDPATDVWRDYVAPVPREAARLAAVEEMSEIIRGFKKK